MQKIRGSKTQIQFGFGKKSVKEYISAIYDYNQLKSNMRASSLAECVCFHGNTPREEGLFERPRLCILCLNVSLNAYR